MLAHAVLNPARRRYPLARRALELGARAAGWPAPVIHLTTRDAPGGEQAAAALAAGAELVVAGGGDGTVREVAAVTAGTGVPLGLLPYGTANLLARNLGLRPSRLTEAAGIALHGPARPIDLGVARYATDDGAEAQQVFLVVAGIGHDAATVRATGAAAKRRLGWLAYFRTGLRHALRRPVAMEVALDGAPPRSVRTWCVLAGNCGRLPGGVRIFPEARPDDGVLEVLEVPLRHPLQWAQVAAKGVLRWPGDVPALRYARAATVEVRTRRPHPAQFDGDVVEGVVHITMNLRPGALLVNAPDAAR
ncbi:diacylglycerol/lipid kinase family protein [Nigerium massiliense]|uniref:diacylglycerol/lipid kinase family protein n=1 Tax=Nigerium massiliense TaxID=1522317 RepID=UPI000694E567|nr:diacylglycerol kinase family protein [Nigerium massiliense]